IPIAPTSSSSFSIGTPRIVRAPARSTRSEEYGPALASAIWTTCFVVPTRARAVFGRGRKTGSRRRFSANAWGTSCIATMRNASPSRSNSVPNLASQRRVAFASIAWNTGSSSPGELEMTPRTSAVAVCCCSDSPRSAVRWRNSLSSRAFSIAITAWSAKPLMRSSSPGWKGRTSLRATIITPIALPCRDSGVNAWDRTGRSRNTRATSPRSFARATRRSSIDIWRLSNTERTARSVGSSGRSGKASQTLAMVGPAAPTTRRTSPSMRLKLTPAASNIRAAVSAIVLSARLLSSGVPAMTRSTSEVAVCCSSASASFLFRSALATRRPSTLVLAFVVFERRPVIRLRLFAPLRAKVTSSAQSLGLPILTHDELASSLDHLVGAAEQQRGHVEADCLCATDVDHQLEPGRLYNRQVGGLGAHENSAGVVADLEVCVAEVCTVGQQSAGCGELTPIVNRRNRVACCQRNNSITPAVQERVGGYKQRTGPLF